MRIDEDGAETYLLNSIWDNSLFKGILELDVTVNMLRHVNLQPQLPSAREDLFHRAVDMVRNGANQRLGEEFYPMLQELHGPPHRHVEPIDEAHTVLMNIISYSNLREAAPWGDRKVVCSRFMEPGILWYVGDLGKFRHDIIITEAGRDLTWDANYTWGFKWADPLPLQCIDVSGS